MKKLIKIFSGLLLIALILTAVVWQASDDQYLKVYFFDVGQGDAILIRTPSRQNIIIDGGPDNSFIAKLGQALPFYDRTVDLMVLTHPHEDHLVGLVEVLKRYQVKEVLATGVAAKNSSYEEWLEIIKEKNILFKTAVSGQRFLFSHDVQLSVLSPLGDLSGRSFLEASEKKSTGQKGNLNNTSVVLILTYGQTSFIFTGDLEVAGEKAIFEKWQSPLQADVLKVGHHGSNGSSGEEFLRAVSPKYAVISVGQDNDYGHPSPLVLKRLERLKIQLWRTDLSGDIILWSDGKILRKLGRNRLDFLKSFCYNKDNYLLVKYLCPKNNQISF